MSQNVGDAHDLFATGLPARRLVNRFVRKQRRVEKAMGVIECRAEQLSARQILVGGGNAAFDLHVGSVERHRIAEPGQGGAIGAQQEDRLDQVAARLAHGKRCKRTVIKRGLRHHPIDGKAELFGNLVDRDGGERTIATASVGEKPVSVADGSLATFDGNIHGLLSLRTKPRSSSCGAGTENCVPPSG
ncbi:hypothetical protein D3C73_703450 [compost metagenome]